MKILTICVPCNESTLSIHSVVESILIQKEFVELVFVLGQGAMHLKEDLELWIEKLGDSIKYVEKPSDVLLVSKGLYFKVLSAQATLEQAGLVKVVSTLQDLLRSQVSLDVLVCDYEYKVEGVKKDIQTYNSVLVQEDIVEWHQMKMFNHGQFFNAKSMVFKTNLFVVNEYGLFYDSIYHYMTLPIYVFMSAKSFLYTTGVLEVSNKVTLEQYIEHVDQGIHYVQGIVDVVDINEVKSRKARYHIVSHFNALFMRIVAALLEEGSIESIQKKEALWYYLKINNYVLYKQCKKLLSGKIIGNEHHRLVKQVVKRVIK